MSTAIVLAAICAAAGCVLLFLRDKRKKDQDELEQHSITAEALHALVTSHQQLLVFDVRQPLDLLAYPEIIPGARRIPPDEVLANPSLIPREQNSVVYCTCPSDKTSRLVLGRALKLKFFQIRFLKGGLAAWKAKGYPVEPYRESFHLHTATKAAGSK